MTKIKLCGLSRAEDIFAANEILPEFVGFVFAQKSRRRVSINQAAELKKNLRAEISAVGVFVDEEIKIVAEISGRGIIDAIQLHGAENDEYIKNLRRLTKIPIIKAFRVGGLKNLELAENSAADFILLDSGAGTGEIFDWTLPKNFRRPYFLAGGLTAENVRGAINLLNPFAVDVSSGIETDGVKNAEKMRQFVNAVRNF